MDVTIIIINYNTRQMTAACIDSVFAKTEGIAFEVILVDNASTDGSREFFACDPRITYLYNLENEGFGRANNRGIALAKGRNILFLNSDTLLVNNAVKILSDYLDRHAHVGACGGNLYYEDRTAAHSFLRYPPSIFMEVNLLLRNIPARIRYGRNICHNYTTHPLDVAYITGADLMVRHDVLKRVGSFNPKFFMYYEETELCHRIRKAHYRIRSVPDAKIIHLESKSFGKSCSASKRRLLTESRNIYFSLTHSPNYTCAARLIRTLAYYTRFPRNRQIG